MTCDLNIIKRIEFDVENSFFENIDADGHSVFDASINGGDGYNKGQRIVSNSVILQSNVDGNNVNPDGYISDDNWRYDSALKKNTYVPLWASTKTYSTGDLVTMETGSFGFGPVLMWRSKQDGNSNNEPTFTEAVFPVGPIPDDDAYWEDITVFDASGYANNYYSIPNWENQNYSTGDTVWHLSQEKGFKAKQSITAVANDPVQTEPLFIVDNPYSGGTNTWDYVEPVNSRSLFDEKADTVTTGATNMRMVIDVNKPFSNLVLLNMTGYSVRVYLYDTITETERYQETHGLYELQNNPYDFYFNHHRPVKDIHITGLPRMSKSQIVLVFDGNGSSTGIGAIVAGVPEKAGEIQGGVSRGAISYTDSSVNSVNKTEIVRGKRVKKATYPVIINAEDYDKTVRIIDSAVDEVCYFYAADQFKELGVLGLLRDHDQVLNNGSYSINSINVQGIY